MVKIHLSTLLDMGMKYMAFPSSLFVKLPQMNAYTKCFDKNNEYINLSVNDKKNIRKKFQDMV